MPAPILATKLYIPSLKPKYVSRLHLIRKLNEGLASGTKLSILSAPAGFGKTTLISEWASMYERPIAWITLDENDSNTISFLNYLVAALQTIKPGIGEAIQAAIQSPQIPPIETLLITLINEIANVTGCFILVLDDYHLIDSTAVDQCLTFLVEHLPQQMHLVIVSREDPPLALPRLRVHGHLTEIRADDLRFTSTEAVDLLNRVMSLNLGTDDISLLETYIEGWVAGLQLAALSMQGQKDTSTFIKSFTGSHHFVLDYLLEEVLHQQPEELQNFLLKTSILKRLCGPLCEAVIKEPGLQGQTTLETLEHANLFIIPLDHERHWYRYHTLFRDLLQKQLGQCLTLNDVYNSHLRACQWYQENGDLSEAFQHALAAMNFDRAAELAALAYRELDDVFQSASWLNWIKKLPEKVICSHPLLCTQIGMAYTDEGELDISETYLQMADHYLEGVGEKPEYRSLPAMIAIAHASNAQRKGDISATVRYAELTLQLTPKEDLLQRAQANVTLGFTYWFKGDLEAALKSMTDWMDSMQKTGNIVFVVASAFAMADMLIELGRLRDAEKSLQGSLELAELQGEEAKKITAHHFLGLAMIARERGDDESFTHRLDSARKLGEETTLVDWPYRWNLAQALIKEGEEDYEAALRLLDEAKKVYVQNPIPDQHPIDTLKVRIFLKQGRLDKAQRWVQKQGCSTRDDINYLNEFEHLMLARVLIAESDFSEVDELLERLLIVSEAQKRDRSVLNILITQSLSYHAQGKLSQARATLERALTMAEAEGYIHIFVDEGKPIQVQLETLSKDRNYPLRGYLAKIISAFIPPLGIKPQSTVNPLQNGLIEPLTDRELEILRLIAQGLSNSEISQRLFLALSTIKGHNLRIFGKLQVQNRTEAVAYARELGLL